VKIIIDLQGPEGNAFYLLGLARILAQTTKEDGRKIQLEMINGDYTHLLRVFKAHFAELSEFINEPSQPSSS
jgi:hypothetical protein